jgi:hypothetical protein
MNDMLAGVDWMRTIKPDDDAYVLAHIDWLKTASPADWHRAALDFNWSNRSDPLLWIVMQEDCELATALNIFWRSEPGWDLMLMARGEKVYKRDEIAIITTIAERLHAGTYKRRKIAFDAEPIMHRDYAEMQADCAKIADPPFRPHPDMIRTIRGREVVNDAAFYRRYPYDFHGSVMVDLPEWDGTTPGMEWAAKELRSVIFNIGLAGAAIYYARFVDWQSLTHLAALALLMVGLFVQLRDANASAATIRSLMRENRSHPSQIGQVLLGGAAFALGYGLFKLGLKSYFALADTGLFHDPGGYGKAVSVVLATGALWGAAWLISRPLTRKVLFR